MIRFKPALNSAFATVTASHDVHNSHDAARRCRIAHNHSGSTRCCRTNDVDEYTRRMVWVNTREHASRGSHCRRIPWRMAKNSTHHKRCCRRITWSARTYKHRAAATSRRISRHAVSERALLPTR